MTTYDSLSYALRSSESRDEDQSTLTSRPAPSSYTSYLYLWGPSLSPIPSTTSRLTAVGWEVTAYDTEVHFWLTTSSHLTEPSSPSQSLRSVMMGLGVPCLVSLDLEVQRFRAGGWDTDRRDRRLGQTWGHSGYRIYFMGVYGFSNITHSFFYPYLYFSIL